MCEVWYTLEEVEGRELDKIKLWVSHALKGDAHSAADFTVSAIRSNDVVRHELTPPLRGLRDYGNVVLRRYRIHHLMTKPHVRVR